MNLHLVGGFLGSGKTTAIIAAAHLLVASGKKVGIITNDQGKFLVDTAFIKSQQLPTTEVNGGCFCCKFDDFTAHIDQLTASVKPDVIFAESVGSCADLVATVIKPLLQFRPKKDTISSFSVVTDSRLLELALLHNELPFSHEVTYIFNQQIEEASLLVINKSDLLSPERRKMVEKLAQEKYPQKQVILQNSQNTAQVKKWLACLESGEAGLPEKSLDLDYQRYATGESMLAWLDAIVEFTISKQPNFQVIINILKEITASVQKTVRSIGHLKFAIRGQNGVTVKLSFTTLEDQTSFIHMANERLDKIQGPAIQLVINIRVEGNAGELKTQIHETIEKEISRGDGNITLMKISSFYPKTPVPTHHLK